MSCLFDSMHNLLRRHGIHIANSHVLRTKVVQMMLTNPQYKLPAPAPSTPIYNTGRCDKCDATDHATNQCPWFKKDREASEEGHGVSIEEWCKMVSGDMRMTPASYVAAMGRPSTWGGGMEIALMSKMFNVKIDVLRSGRKVSAFDCTNGKPDAQFILHWTGSHYTPHAYESLRDL